MSMRRPSIKIRIRKDVFLYIMNFFGETEDDYIGRKFIFSEDESIINTTVANLRKYCEFLKVPITIFMLSEVPNFERLLVDHRSRTDVPFTKNTINAIRRAHWFQSTYLEITTPRDGLGISFTLDDDPKVAGNKVSQLINFEELRSSSYKTDNLYRELRRKLDQYDILVFQSEFPPEETRGFSIANINPSVIMVNKKQTSYGARIFTVLHELGHIILNMPGISDPKHVVDASNQIEVWCNKFAASIVLPDHLVGSIDIDDSIDIGRILEIEADNIKVSKLALAVALLNINKIDRETFEEFRNRPYKSPVSDKVIMIPGHRRVTSNLGRKFTEEIIRAYQQNSLSRSDAAGILKSNDKAFNYLIHV